jgi:hypothetical protein
VAEGEHSPYPAIDTSDIKLFFCESRQGVSRIDELKVNLFGTIENWPQDFFGDQFGEIAARDEAALKKQAAAE